MDAYVVSKALPEATICLYSISTMVGSSVTSISSKIQELLSRVEELERQRFSKCYIIDDASSTIVVPIDVVDESMRRARYAVETTTTYHYSAIWKFVPQHYYNISLDERAQCLRAPSIHYLCKSLLLENRKVSTEITEYDPTNPRFVLVILQYASTLDVKKLSNAIRKLRTDVTQRLDETQFDFRIASELDNDIITGYTHNSVTPFGMLCQQQQQQVTEGNTPPIKNVPIILSSSLMPLQFFWMGGGHVHLKLGMSISDFCFSLNPIIADVSRPRTSLLDNGGTMDDDI
jgi:prolyl-tRNA editing enzyme YbaK/EbsC (Cys-tRNA(Pro) deacylase)